MDDEEFILVSKAKIQKYEAKISKLEDENKELKEVKKKAPQQNTSNDKASKAKKDDELKKLKTFISKKHTELKQEIVKELEEVSNLKKLPLEVSKELDKKFEKTQENEFETQKPHEANEEISRYLEDISSRTSRIHKDIKEYNSQIISNVKLLVEHLQDSKAIEEVQESIHQLKSQIEELAAPTDETYQEVRDTSNVELQIFEKLQEIELFMANLRTLLSYVKPKYIEREK